MTRYLLTLKGTRDRDSAKKYIDAAPFGTRVELKAERRSLPQNDKMWSCLTEIAQQVEWHGIKLRPDDWKLIFLDALKRENRLVPNIEGNGFVNLGRSSSDLTKEEMSEMIELIHAFGAEHDVVFNDPTEQAA